MSSLSSSGNLLLRHLGPGDAGLLRPHLHPVALARGDVLLRAAHGVETIYFPEAGMVSVEGAIGGNSVEIAIVGREGLLGWPALLGNGRSVHDAVVRGQDGRGLAILAVPLLAACQASATLRTLLLSFVESLMVQMARTIASQIESTLEERVARWLLMRHDRIGGDQLIVRHDEVAAALNARRASITDRLHMLEGRRLIRCRRGRLIVRDRAALERFAGDAYGTAELSYRELLGPFGKSVALAA